MTNWKQIGKSVYIDIDSINEVGESIFECWVKYTSEHPTVKKAEQSHGYKISHAIIKYLIDKSYKTFGIKQIIIYNTKGEIVEQGTVNIMEVEWTEIPPDSLANNIYDIVTGRISIESLQEYSERAGCYGLFLNIISVPLRWLFRISSFLVFLFALCTVISLFTGEFKNLLLFLCWTIGTAIFSFILYSIMETLGIEIIKKE